MRGQIRYRIVDTPEALADFVARLSQQQSVSLDTETTSLHAAGPNCGLFVRLER